MQVDLDPSVLDAMRRWPNVPAVYGWLRLDRRGIWHLVDRSAAEFDEDRHGRGDPIRNRQIVAFIGRNYLAADDGAWYWQNGPQRVFVDLDLTPWILRVRSDLDGGQLLTHTGLPIARVDAAFEGPAGELLVQTELGPAAIHDLDLGALELDESGVLLVGRRFALQRCDDPATALDFRPRPRSD
ncbi:MAG: DUF2946 family protein [Burkholderiaceae bacterium]